MGLHSPTQIFVGPHTEKSVVIEQCAKYGNVRGYQRLVDYYTQQKLPYYLITFNHEREGDAAVKGMRHRRKPGGGTWFCDKIPRHKYVDFAFMRDGDVYKVLREL